MTKNQLSCVILAQMEMMQTQEALKEIASVLEQHANGFEAGNTKGLLNPIIERDRKFAEQLRQLIEVIDEAHGFLRSATNGAIPGSD